MPEPTRIIRIDSKSGSVAELAPAVEALRAGKLVAFPTETVYGLGVVASDGAAVERLRAVKGRPKSPFSVHLGSPGEVSRYVRDVPPRAKALLARAWPGPLTILLPVGKQLAGAELHDKAMYERLCPEGVIGLRCPDDRLALELLKGAASPVLATSANLAGQPPPHTAEDVLAQLEGKIELLVDGGPARYGQPSTIVAVDGNAVRLVRAGVYDARAVERMSRCTLLFVCTGNTCRSPLAAALARKLLSERLGVPEGKLDKAGVEIQSAGVFGGGAPASPRAVATAARLGAKIGRHRSRKATAQLIRAADLVFCMTEDHVAEVTRLAPDASGRTFRLDPAADIEDPAGGDDQTYLSTARRIAACLERRLKEYWP